MSPQKARGAWPALRVHQFLLWQSDVLLATGAVTWKNRGPVTAPWIRNRPVHQISASRNIPGNALSTTDAMQKSLWLPTGHWPRTGACPMCKPEDPPKQAPIHGADANKKSSVSKPFVPAKRAWNQMCCAVGKDPVARKLQSDLWRIEDLRESTVSAILVSTLSRSLSVTQSWFLSPSAYMLHIVHIVT